MASKLGNGKVRKDQTDHYGRVKRSGGGATIEDFEDSDTVEFEETSSGKVTAHATAGGSVQADDFTGSETINFSDDVETGKPQANLEASLVNRIQKALVTPIESPEETELVGITDQGAQARVEIGEGLTLEDNVLKATGGSIHIEIPFVSSGTLTEEELEKLKANKVDTVLEDSSPTSAPIYRVYRYFNDVQEGALKYTYACVYLNTTGDVKHAFIKINSVSGEWNKEIK